MSLSSLEQLSVPATEIVAGREGMKRLGPEWRQLADRCPTATVFQTFEWNNAWWRRFGRRLDRRLCLLTFRDSETGRLVGLAPLMTSFVYGTLLRRLSFVGTGASDYLDVLAEPGLEAEVARAFYSGLVRRRNWQIADFQQLRDGGFLRSQLPGPETGLVVADRPGEACPFLPLPGDWETLTRQFGKKTRSNISYYDRALHKVFAVEIGSVTDPRDLDPEMARLFELHQRRWNQRWLPGVFGSSAVRRFHREAAAALLERGFLRLFFLRLDGQTQACLYCFAFGDRLCYYQGGFEPTLGKWSLGTVLTARALQQSIAEGRQIFDFLRGDEPYKAKWTGATAVNHRRLVTRMGPWTGVAEKLAEWEDQIEQRAKAWARQRR